MFEYYRDENVVISVIVLTLMKHSLLPRSPPPGSHFPRTIRTLLYFLRPMSHSSSSTGGHTNLISTLGSTLAPSSQHATLTAQPSTQAAPSEFSQAVASLRPLPTLLSPHPASIPTLLQPLTLKDIQHVASPPSESNPGGLLLAGEYNLVLVSIGGSFPC